MIHSKKAKHRLSSVTDAALFLDIQFSETSQESQIRRSVSTHCVNEDGSRNLLSINMFQHLSLLVLVCFVLSFSSARRLPLVAGNWKMNTDLKSAIALATEVLELTKDVDPNRVEIALIPPYPFLTAVQQVC